MVASRHWTAAPGALTFQPKETLMTLTLYAATAAVFLLLDAIMLTLVMKPLFTRHIGPLLAEPIRIAPAALFYLAYVAGLVYLVSFPALKTGTPRWLSSATGMLLVPAPARATARTLAGISSLCMSAERTRIASGCGISLAIW